MQGLVRVSFHALFLLLFVLALQPSQARIPNLSRLLSTIKSVARKSARQIRNGRPAGQTNIRPTGQTNVRPTGQTNVRPTGQTNARPTGQTNARPTGQTNARPTGQTNARPTGQTNARPTGQTNARPTGQTDIRPAEQTQTLPKFGGHIMSTKDYEAIKNSGDIVAALNSYGTKLQSQLPKRTKPVNGKDKQTFIIGSIDEITNSMVNGDNLQRQKGRTNFVESNKKFPLLTVTREKGKITDVSFFNDQRIGGAVDGNRQPVHYEAGYAGGRAGVPRTDGWKHGEGFWMFREHADKEPPTVLYRTNSYTPPKGEVWAMTPKKERIKDD